MARMAVIKDGIVSNIIVAEVGAISNTVEIPDGVNVQKGYTYNGTDFSEPVGRDRLEVTLSETVIDANTSANLTATVRKSNGDVIPADLTYYVPIMGIDGRQVTLVQVDFIAGVANVTLDPLPKGIYTLMMDKIRPIPTAQLSEAPELIVK